MKARSPSSGITAIEFAPELTAYSVRPSGDSVTAKVAAPVTWPWPWSSASPSPSPWREPGSSAAGARASILAMTLLRRGVDDRDLVGVVLRHEQRATPRRRASCPARCRPA